MKHLGKNLVRLLDTEDRRSFAIFVAISFFSGVIEVIGVGSIMPFIGVLMQPDLITENQILSSAYETFNFRTSSQFLFFLGMVTLAFITLGGICNIFSIRYQLKITHKIGHKLAVRLLSSYLSQPYSFYLRTNTNVLKSSILSDVDRVVSSVLIPAATIISKAMVITIILLLLLFINPTITALLFVITGGVYAGLIIYFRKKMKTRGQQALQQNAIRFKIVNESFSCIRDIKLHDNADFFEDQFNQASKKFADLQAYSLYHGQIPKFIIEMVGFFILILLILFLISEGNNHVQDIIPLIALFAASGYKILPAAQNLYSSLNSIRFNSAGLESVAQGVSLTPEHAQNDKVGSDLHFNNAITMDKICFSYENASEKVLKDISLQIKKNSLIGVVGPTGAGKSTLIDILIGLIPPDSGQILIDETPLTAQNLKSWQKKIGYVPQHVQLISGSIASNIAFGKEDRNIDWERIDDAARNAHIHTFIQDLPDGYKTDVRENGDRLSGGQRQRIGIARALYHAPDIIVLDEPTSALDPETAQNIILTLKSIARERTIILITHDLDRLSHCDQIIFVNNGQAKSASDVRTLAEQDQVFSDLLKAKKHE